MFSPVPSLRCALQSYALRAVEARQMDMSLLGSLVLLSRAGSWSAGFNIKILVYIPVVACTTSLIVLGCRFKTPADWHIFNSLNFAPQIPQMWWFTCLAPPCPYWKWRQSIHFILRPHSQLMGFSFPSWSYLSLTFGSFGFSSQKHLLIDPFSCPVAGLCTPCPSLRRMEAHTLSPKGVFPQDYHPLWVLPPFN